VLLSLEMGTEMPWVFKKLDDKVPKKKTVIDNFCYALFSLLDFLTLEAGI
jgi:hypothetical protein